MQPLYKSILLACLLCLVGSSSRLAAQVTYTVSESNLNLMKLSGTSTLHDWEMISPTFTGKAQFEFTNEDQNEVNAITSLSFSIKAEDLKSDSKGLDKNAYKALKTKEYDRIYYSLISANISPLSAGKFSVKTLGSLTIAGVKKEIEMTVTCKTNADGSITCEGSKDLIMSEFGVEPPSFMFGAMTTGDLITLNFNIVYEN